MKDFVKLFGTGAGQIVAIRKEGDDGNPEVRLFFRTSNPILDVCEIGLSYKAAADADAAFANLTHDIAKQAVEASGANYL